MEKQRTTFRYWAIGKVHAFLWWVSDVLHFLIYVNGRLMRRTGEAYCKARPDWPFPESGAKYNEIGYRFLIGVAKPNLHYRKEAQPGAAGPHGPLGLLDPPDCEDR